MTAAAPVYQCDSKIDEAAWLAMRREGIGSSDAPAVCGIHGCFGSAATVRANKDGVALTADQQSQGDIAELLEWGHYVEAPMVEKFKAETGFQAKISGLMYRHGHPERHFMLSTNDGKVVEDSGKLGGLECKLKVYHWEEWEREGIPQPVICQMQHTMEVMDWDFMYCLVLLDGYKFRWSRVSRDREIVGDLIAPDEAEFWRRFLENEPVDLTIGRPSATATYLKSLYPEDNGETVQLEGQEWLTHLSEMQTQKALEKHAKEEKERHRHALAGAMGEATFAILENGQKLSLKTTKREAYPVKATSFRVLRETKK